MAGLSCDSYEVAAFRWVSIAGTLGLVASVTLLLLSVCSRQKRAVLGRLVIGLALADTSAILVTFVPVWVERGSFFVYPSVPWCEGYVFTTLSLFMWSELLSASISIAVLLALLGRVQSLERMRWAPVLTLPVAFLINSVSLLPDAAARTLNNPDRMPNGLSLDCEASRSTYVTYAVALGIVLVLVSGITVYSFVRIKRRSPESSAWRAFSCGRRYWLAFLLTYAVKVLAPTHWSKSRDERTNYTCESWTWVFLADSCVMLNGFFNLVAYRGLNFKLSHHRAVVFSSFTPTTAIEPQDLTELPQRRALQTSDPTEEPEDPWLMLWGDEEAHSEARSGSMASLSSLSSQGSHSPRDAAGS